MGEILLKKAAEKDKEWKEDKKEDIEEEISSSDEDDYIQVFFA